MERRAVNLSFQRSEEYEFGAALLPQEKSEVRLGDLHGSLCATSQRHNSYYGEASIYFPRHARHRTARQVCFKAACGKIRRWPNDDPIFEKSDNGRGGKFAVGRHDSFDQLDGGLCAR